MEYIYSAMILHSAGKEINEAAVASILKAAGVEADTSRIKALTASLDGVDIEEAMKTAVAAPAVQETGSRDSSVSRPSCKSLWTPGRCAPGA